MTLYKVHFAAGLTELETEVRPVLGMQRQVGGGSAPGDCPCVMDWVRTPLLAQSLLPYLNCLHQELGVVPGEPRTCLCWEPRPFYTTGTSPEAMAGPPACDQAPLSAVDLKLGLFWQPFLFLRGMPPDGRGVSTARGVRSRGFVPCSLGTQGLCQSLQTGLFPTVCFCLCPFPACSLRAAALQPSIYMALICLSLFGTYMAPIGPGPECLPIFNIFIFTHADTHAYLWGQEVPVLLLYRWRTLNGNWLNWEQVVAGMEEGCSHMVQKMASQEMVHKPQCSTGKVGLPAHTWAFQSVQYEVLVMPYPCFGLFILQSCFKIFLSQWCNFTCKASVELPSQDEGGRLESS